MRVSVVMKDGSVWKPKSTSDWAGWDSQVEFRDGFVIVRDEFGTKTAFPAPDVERVNQEERPRW